jgi:hypothetical protein
MTQTAQHTPLPWKVKTYRQIGSLKRPEIYGPSPPDGNEYSALCSIANEADARLIVRACNSAPRSSYGFRTVFLAKSQLPTKANVIGRVSKEKLATLLRRPANEQKPGPPSGGPILALRLRL